MKTLGNRFQLLISPIYLGAVGLLLLNDFALKHARPGWFTGKLSDFAGLFAFTVFVLVLWPRTWTPILVAVAFAFWKSPFSDSAILAWNSLTGFKVGRTIDYSDLVALISVPLAWMYHRDWTPAQ